ncbi:MAG: hypothetical protein MJE68_27225 [Proteobacteria bacterium]|nr:hypothetical protein [Pseudomonadota bacterium]
MPKAALKESGRIKTNHLANHLANHLNESRVRITLRVRHTHLPIFLVPSTISKLQHHSR